MLTSQRRYIFQVRTLYVLQVLVLCTYSYKQVLALHTNHVLYLCCTYAKYLDIYQVLVLNIHTVFIIYTNQVLVLDIHQEFASSKWVFHWSSGFTWYIRQFVGWPHSRYTVGSTFTSCLAVYMYCSYLHILGTGRSTDNERDWGSSCTSCRCNIPSGVRTLNADGGSGITCSGC